MVSDLVYDVGMNNGDDTAFYLRRGFRVVAVEAHPQLAREARDKFAREIAAGKLAIENLAVSDACGELEFWQNDEHAEWSSFHKEIAGRAGHRLSSVKVPCVDIGELFRRHGVPHYLKIDIEGNDEMCLAGLTRADPPRYLSLETFEKPTLDRLRDLGYTGFKFIDQASFTPITIAPDDQYQRFWQTEAKLAGRSLLKKILRRTLGPSMRRAAAPRRQLDGWTFPAGSSGPFGEDTAGAWLSHDDAVRTFEHFEHIGRTDSWAWRDLHARAGA